MKIVREHINFERTHDSYYHKIDKWKTNESLSIDDLSTDDLREIDLINKEFNILKFNKMDKKSVNFKRTGDSLEDMSLGMKARISQWLDMKDIEGYRIKEDFTIDVAKDVNLVGQELDELPEFINFNKIWGGFYAGGNPWQSLKGFPKIIYGDLQINSISNIMDPNDINPNITEKFIKKIIKVHGEIFI